MGASQAFALVLKSVLATAIAYQGGDTFPHSMQVDLRLAIRSSPLNRSETCVGHFSPTQVVANVLRSGAAVSRVYFSLRHRSHQTILKPFFTGNRKRKTPCSHHTVVSLVILDHSRTFEYPSATAIPNTDLTMRTL